MAGKSLTRVQGGVTDTININNDKFAGVRTMTSGYVYPPSIITLTSGSSTHWSATETNGSWTLDSTLGNDSTTHFGSLVLVPTSAIRLGKHRVEFEITVNSGTIDNGSSKVSDRPLVLVVRDYDDDPSTTAHSQIHEVFVGANTLDVEVFDDGINNSVNYNPSLFLSARPSSVFNITVSNIKVTHNYGEHTVNHTVSSGVSTLTSGYEYPADNIPKYNQSHFRTTKTDNRNFRVVSNLVGDGDDGAGSTRYVNIKTKGTGLRLGKHRLTFDVTLNGSTVASDISNFMFRLSKFDTFTSLQPTVGSNTFDIEITDDGVPSQPKMYFAFHTKSVYDISISNLKLVKNYEEHVVDHTPPRRVRTLTSGHVYPALNQQIFNETYYSVTRTGNPRNWVVKNDLANDPANNEHRYNTLVDLYRGNQHAVGKHRVTFDVELTSGSLADVSTTTTHGEYSIRFSYRDKDADSDDGSHIMSHRVTEGGNVFDIEIFDDGDNTNPTMYLAHNKEGNYEVSITNLTITHNYGESTLDETVPKALPLLSKVSGGASAAYSLRDLNDKQGNSKVVRVRRDIDSQERDFIAKDIGKPLEDWVAGKLDTKLPADFKDSSGNSLASGAYSLRKVKADYEGPAVDLSIAEKDSGYYSTSSCSIGFDRNNEVSLDSPVISGSYKDGQTLRDLVKPSRLDYGYANFERSRAAQIGTNLSFETLDDKGNFNYTLNNNPPDSSFYIYIGGQHYTAGTYEMTGSIKVSYNQLGAQPVCFHWGWATNRTFPDPTNGNGGTVYEFTEDNPLRLQRSRAGFAGPFLYNNSDVRVDNLYVEVRNLQVKVISQAATVSKWYDQSGNNNHLENPTYNQQPHLVRPTGEIVRDRNGKAAISDKSYVLRNSDGTNRTDINEQYNAGTCLKFPEGADMLSADGSYSMFAVMDLDDQTQSLNNFNDVVRMWSYNTPSGVSPRKPQLYLPKSHGGLDVTGPSYSQGGVQINKSMAMKRQLFVNIADPSEASQNNKLRTDGALSHSKDDATVVNDRTSIRGTHGIFDQGEKWAETFISEFIYYPSNQKLNEFSIESNINNHWNMFDPQSDGDGHVSIWYDQSSYGNDVAQSVIHYQPRLVIDGQLSLTPDGKPAVKFSEKTHMIASVNAQGLLSDTGHSTSFVVAAHGGDLPHHTWHNHWVVISTETDPNRYGVNRRPYIFRSYSNSAMTLTHDSGGGPYQPMDDDTTAMFTCIIRGLDNSETLGQAAISKNGGTETISNKVWQYGAALDRKLNKGTGLDYAKIGNRYGDGRGPFEQWIVEIIHYASDQTANAPALNANIINQYEL